MDPIQFGRYVLLDRLGSGGMGEIYVAAHGELPSLRKLFALKKIRPALSRRSEYMGRFWDEARVVISLAHPNIVPVYEIGCVEQEYFLAMELVEGYDLWRVLARCQRHGRLFSIRAALYVVRELLAALEYCHELTDPAGHPLRLVHRDVSPANVLLSWSGEVKLTDFGLARSRNKVVETQPRVVLGKPGYVAPEQLRGERVDHRADIYSTGVLLHELLTNERFTEPVRDPALLLRAMERRGAAPVSSIRGRLPRNLDLIVARALAMDPQRRFSGARAFREAVQVLLARMDPLYGPRKFVESTLEPLFDRRALDRRLRRALSVEPPTLVMADSSRTRRASGQRSPIRSIGSADTLAPEIDSLALAR